MASLGTLTLTLSAETAAFLKGMQAATASMEKTIAHARKMASAAASAGRAMAALGAGIVVSAAKWDPVVNAAMTGVTNSFASFSVEAGRLLIPALKSISSALKTLADYVAGLTPAQREMAETVLKWAAAFAVGSTALAVALPLLQAMALAVGALFGVLASPAIVAFAVIAGGLVVLHKIWRENWGGIQGISKSVAANTQGYFRQAFIAVGRFAVDAVRNIANGFKIVIDAAEFFAGMLGINISKVANFGRDIAAWAKNLTTSEGLNALVDDAGNVGNALVSGVSAFGDELKIILKEGADLAKKVMPTFAKGTSFTPGGGVRAAPSPMAFGGGGPRGGAGGVLGGMNDALRAGDRALLRWTDSLGTSDKALKVWEFERLKSKGRGNLEDVTGEDDREKAMQDEVSKREAGVAEVVRQQQEGAARWVQAIGQSFSAAAQTLTSRMGAVGEIIQAAAQGFATAGPWGAIIAVLSEFLSRLEGFTKFSEFLNKKLEATLSKVNEMAKPLFEALTSLSDALNPLRAIIHSVIGLVLKVIAPIIKFVGNILGKLFSAITPLISVFTDIGDVLGTVIGTILELVGMLFDLLPITEIIGVVFQALGKTISFASIGILGIVLGVIRAVENIIKAFGGNVTSVKKAGDDVEKKMNEMASKILTGFDGGLKTTTTSVKDLGDAADKASDKFGEMLTNLPSGFKLRGLQFAADTGAGGGGGGGPAGGAGGGGPAEATALTREEEAAQNVADALAEAEQSAAGIAAEIKEIQADAKQEKNEEKAKGNAPGSGSGSQLSTATQNTGGGGISVVGSGGGGISSVAGVQTVTITGPVTIQSSDATSLRELAIAIMGQAATEAKRSGRNRVL